MLSETVGLDIILIETRNNTFIGVVKGTGGNEAW